MQIKVLSIPTCPWCKKLKEWLKKKKVQFEDIDVSETQNAKFRDELIEKTGQMGVPITIITNNDKETVLVGFNPEKLEEALEKSK
ncbi:MAG: NrdH-redoxin [Nanoarchaeota archaeon]|nr:NrdH-redoxin [Nanoarchaeota archaeon]MBU1622312.1 NrdH-redoxin [Nanoarchaeota archaeon]MBU1974135.1 NrdH-redoxin [Nanoarchaeota archaeon]